MRYTLSVYSSVARVHRDARLACIIQRNALFTRVTLGTPPFSFSASLDGTAFSLFKHASSITASSTLRARCVVQTNAGRSHLASMIYMRSWRLLRDRAIDMRACTPAYSGYASCTERSLRSVLFRVGRR